MADGTRGGSNDAALPLIATDDAGVAGQVQIVKLAQSADGSATVIDADGSGLKVQLGAALPAGTAAIGKLTANSGVDIGDVDVTSVAGNVTVVQPTAANLNATVTGTIDTELTTADLDTGVGTDTRAVVGLVGSKSGGGQLIPGDATAGLKVDLGADNDVTVTSLPALVAGTANIGDVDVLTVPAPLSTTGGGTEATAHRVTIANDSTGVLSVDDNGGALTVDNAGTFAVQDSDKLADNAGFTDGTTKLMPTGFIFDEVAGTALTENDIAAPRVNANRASVATIEDGATRARYATVTAANALKVDNSAVTQPVSGTITANQGTAGTAWEVVGDVAHDAAAPANPVVIGAQMETMADSAPGTRSSTDGDATKLATADGAQFVIPTGPQTFTLHATGVQTGAQIHAAPGAGLSCYITAISFSIGAATASSVKVLNNGGSDFWGPHYLEAINGRGLHVIFPTPLKGTANTRIDVTTTGAATQTVDIQGFIAPG